MKVYEFGEEHTKIFAMFQCAVEPWWVFKASAEDIPVKKAIIDAGITPYPYPKWICRLISVKDWIMIMLATRSLRMMKLACPPERWTPGGEDPEAHYRALLEFYKQHYSPRTIYNVFWSTDNYSVPDPVPQVDTMIEYWYGEEEKRAGEVKGFFGMRRRE